MTLVERSPRWGKPSISREAEFTWATSAGALSQDLFECLAVAGGLLEDQAEVAVADHEAAAKVAPGLERGGVAADHAHRLAVLRANLVDLADRFLELRGV